MLTSSDIKQDILGILRLYFSILFTFLLIQKPLFLLYNLGHGDSHITLTELWHIYQHGLTLDIAATGYLSAFPLLVLLVWSLIPRLRRPLLLRGYNLFLALLITLTTVADAALYEFWEFKLDSTIFMYIGDPKNAMASVSPGYVLIRLGAILLLTFLLFLLYTRALVGNTRPATERSNRRFWAIPVYLLLGGCMFAGMRGIDIWPNTPSKAYYSQVVFYNHCAVNPFFNLTYSLSHRSSFRKEMRFMEDEEVNQMVPPLFPTTGKSRQVLQVSRPNILYIIMEGMGSLFIDELGNPDRLVPSPTGELPRDVAPHLSQLMQEGVCFDQCYGGSFRTDRGVVCAISGYLGQPTTSIMRYSQKVASLPGLAKSLKQVGYSTQVLYASDITFFNMSDYFLATGHERLVSQEDFSREERSAKWGVPDHIACQWLLKDIRQKEEANQHPWYTTFLTISSHAPFDVPYSRMKDEKLNSFAYTDECIGHLIDSLRVSPSWENLLVVITADHGFNLREMVSENFPLIPFLMTGGAVKENIRLSYPVSQTDIPATILGQLGIDHQDFPFSRDVLADTYTYPFAFNTFNNGFNMRDSLGTYICDIDAKRAVLGDDKQKDRMGKAILQYLYNDLDGRGHTATTHNK